MKKIIVIVLVVIVLAVATLWVQRAPLVSWGMTRVLGVPVSIGSIDVSANSVAIRNLDIHNPAGTKIKSAFKAEKIEVRAKPTTLLFGDVVKIEAITLNNAFLGVVLYNLTGSDNNWGRIMKNVSTEGAKEKEKKKDAKEAKGLVVKLVGLYDINVQAYSRPLRRDVANPQISKIEIKNIGSEKDPASVAELFDAIARELLGRISGEGGLQNLMQDVPRSFGDIPKLVPEGGGGGLKGLFK